VDYFYFWFEGAEEGPGEEVTSAAGVEAWLLVRLLGQLLVDMLGLFVLKAMGLRLK